MDLVKANFTHKTSVMLQLWYEQDIFCFGLYFPLKLCTRMLFCNKKWVTQGWRHALWEPFGTSRPISVHKRMSCSLSVCFGPCQPLPSIFISLFPLPFYRPHTPFQTVQILVCCALLYFLPHRILCRRLVCGEQTGSGMLSQRALWLRGRSRVLQGVPHFFVCVSFSLFLELSGC